MIATIQNGYVQLDALDLSLAAIVLVVNGALSFAWRLGLGSRLAVAAARATVQLLAVGLVLDWIFGLRGPIERPTPARRRSSMARHGSA